MTIKREDFIKEATDAAVKVIEATADRLGLVNDVFTIFTAYGNGTIDERVRDAAGKQYAEMGNFFNTREAAEKHIEKIRARVRIEGYIAERFPFVPDWDNQSQSKCYIVHTRGGLLTTDTCYTSNLNCPFYFATAEDAQRTIRGCEADLRVVFGAK